MILNQTAFFRQIDGFAPTFEKKPAIRQEDDGKRLFFECRVKADPTPVISWFHNTTAVQESSRHKVSMVFYLWFLGKGLLR